MPELICVDVAIKIQETEEKSQKTHLKVIFLHIYGQSLKLFVLITICFRLSRLLTLPLIV